MGSATDSAGTGSSAGTGALCIVASSNVSAPRSAAISIDGGGGAEDAFFANGVPQSKQNFAAGGLRAPQLVQGLFAGSAAAIAKASGGGSILLDGDGGAGGGLRAGAGPAAAPATPSPTRGHGEPLRRGLVGRVAVAGSESQSCLGGLFVRDGEGAQLLGERLGNLGGRREAGGRCRVRRLPGFGEERQAAVRAHGHAGLVVGLAAAADIAQRLRRGKLGLRLLLPQRRPASLALVGGVFVLLAARRTGNHGCASIRAARRMGQSADNKGRIDHWHTASNRVSGGLPELS